MNAFALVASTTDDEQVGDARYEMHACPGWTTRRGAVRVTRLAVEPGEYVLTCGKYAGRTPAEVHAVDPSYLRWVVAEGKGEALDIRSQQMRVTVPVVRMYLAERSGHRA